MKLAPEGLMVEMDAPLCIIPGHIIKTADAPHTPVCIVPEGGGKNGQKVQRSYAKLFVASPKLLAACERCIQALDANGAPNCEAVKEARAAIQLAGGGA